jgi:hypothetical protein
MDDKEAAAKFADLQKEAKGHAAQTLKTRAKLKELKAQLAAAAKDADALEMEAVQSAIEAEVEILGGRLVTAKLMVEDLKKLQANNQFIVARIADFRALVHEVAAYRTELMKDLDDAKKLDEEAKRQDDALRDSQSDALRELAEIESNMSPFKRFGERLKASDELLASATESAKLRMKDSLKSEQARAQQMSVKGAYQTLGKLEANVAAVLQKYRAKGFEEKVMKKINEQAKAILLTGSTARKLMDGIEANLAKIDDLDIPKIDLAKAGRSLAITDKAQLAELDKALSGSLFDAEKGLEALGAKLTPRKKGKAMVAQLQKDKVL